MSRSTTACFHFILVFVRIVFVLLAVEIDTGDPEGVTDTISSGKRIRPAKRRRALTTCRFPVIFLPTGICSSAANWGYDGVAV